MKRFILSLATAMAFINAATAQQMKNTSGRRMPVSEPSVQVDQMSQSQTDRLKQRLDQLTGLQQDNSHTPGSPGAQRRDPSTSLRQDTLGRKRDALRTSPPTEMRR